MACTTNTVSTTANYQTGGNVAADAFDRMSKRLSDTLDSLTFNHSAFDQQAQELSQAFNNLTGCATVYNTGTTTTSSGPLLWSDSTTTTTPISTTNKYTVTVPQPTNIFISDMMNKSLDDYFRDLVAQESQKQQPTTKEKKNTMNIFGQFGPVTDGSIALSVKGMAVKSPAGKYVAYDANSEEMFDVDIMSFKTKAPIFFKMPTAINDIEMGDVIVHNDSHYCFVLDSDGKQFTVIDITTSEQRIILPQKSPFGFNFVTKIVSLINPGSANMDTPFGNMLPFVMLNGDNDLNDMLPMLILSGQMGDIGKNPILMYLLMKNGGMMDDMLPFFLMMSK